MLGYWYVFLDIGQTISRGLHYVETAANPEGRLTEELVFIDYHGAISTILQ
jgi:hypothetical protein